MNGTRAKKLRRLAYGPRKDWTLEGYFPNHPLHRAYTVMKTYQRPIPKTIRADKDTGTPREIAASVKLPGADGHTYHYRYVSFTYNGMIFADHERRQYRAYKWWWKNKGIVCNRLKH